MPLTCVSNDAILKKPLGLDYSNPSRTVPFTLNGAPYANQPQSISNKRETVSYVIPGIPGKEATATSPAVGPTADSIGYRIDDINTANIIGENSATTLKYDNNTYTQKFIAVHQGIWGDSRPHVSILLLSPESNFFHLCIPITLSSGDQDENLFLKHWLHGGIPPSGFTLNQILNFRGPNVDKVNLAIIQYCLKYNSGANTNPYTLCIFKQALNLNTKDLPWISNFSGISKPTFDKVLNYMLNGIFRNNDRRIVSTEEHFSSSSGTATVPIPTFFIVKSSELTGKNLFSQGSPVKKLNNIKCYPIDLFNQLDDEGNIFIDEDSKKPIDVKTVNDPSADILKNSKLEFQRQQSLNNLSFIVVFSILFGIICIILIVLSVWFFSGKPSTAQTASASASAAQAVAPAVALAVSAAPGSGDGGGGESALSSIKKMFTGKQAVPRPGSVKNSLTQAEPTQRLNPTPGSGVGDSARQLFTGKARVTPEPLPRPGSVRNLLAKSAQVPVPTQVPTPVPTQVQVPERVAVPA